MMLFFLKRKKIWKTSSRALLWLVIGIFVFHVLGMMIFEHMTVFDAIWLTATTIVTVGYGDMSAKTEAGRVCTMILYFFGIFMFASLVTNVSTKIYEHRLKKFNGKWRWNMKDHIIFIASDSNNNFVVDVVKELRTNGINDDIVVINESSESHSVTPPSYFDTHNIALVRTHGDETDAFKKASLGTAKLLVILCNHNDVSKTINYVHLTRYLGHNVEIIAEVVNELEDRVLAVGANRVVRPLRNYPEQLSREIIAPHSANIIESLFDSFGPTLISVDVNLKTPLTWSNYVKDSIDTKTGTPIAYLTSKNEVILNPTGDVDDIKKVFLIKG